ncbi:MAG: nucleotidyltransferase domain-containing protein [Rhodopseudomonas palustris]|uniref:Nucleotidyltransferase domain-containing protein n=1 Tax=Rhodopseudomonas palustris TaxID=1076 RepID=A0A933W254_RHOPL|nr:nucleotidyltransferase domain-containing protein [Rhodopseudomonas palustris]
MGELSERREQTAARLKRMREGLSEAEELAHGKACVYATGSYGRGEACEHSDLDLFIVGRGRTSDGQPRRRSMLSRLDEICIKADLIHLTRELGIEDFSGEGEYLEHYSVDDLTKSVGARDDDSANTLTARLLLLLEGAPLVGAEIYSEMIEEVVSAYWRDFEDHRNCFVPAFLANDILRLWRTFCVNYEARTLRDPPDKKAKGKLKNYKLKHSRMLTCYSALLMLLFQFKIKQTVRPGDAVAIARLAPTERLEILLQREQAAAAHPAIRQLLERYEKFLAVTNAPEHELLQRFSTADFVTKRFKEAAEFGDSMADALHKLGDGNRFYRLLVV